MLPTILYLILDFFVQIATRKRKHIVEKTGSKQTNDFTKNLFVKNVTRSYRRPGLRNVWIVSTNTRNLKLKYVGLINKDLVICYKTELAWNLLPESLE